MAFRDKKRFLSKLGQWIFKVRKISGMGQDRITQKAGLSKGTLSKIESGRVDPKITTLAKIAHSMDVPLKRLTDIRS